MIFLILILRQFEIQRYINAQYIRELFTLNWYYSFPIFILLCCLANLSNTPATLIYTSVVWVMHRDPAIPLIFVGSVSACLFTFLTASLVTKGVAIDIQNQRLKKWMKNLETRPIKTLFILRLLFQFLPTLNYALAFSKIRFKDYFWGTFLGMILPAIFLSFFYEFLLKTGKIIP